MVMLLQLSVVLATLVLPGASPLPRIDDMSRHLDDDDGSLPDPTRLLMHTRFGNNFLEELRHPRINANSYLNITQEHYVEDILAIAASVAQQEMFSVPGDDRAVVHVRCSDIPFNRHKKYHLQFKEYYAWVAREISGNVSRVHLVMCPQFRSNPRRWNKAYGLSGIPEFGYTAQQYQSKCTSFANVIRKWFKELLPSIPVEPVMCLTNEDSINLFARSKYLIAGGAAPSSFSFVAGITKGRNYFVPYPYIEIPPGATDSPLNPLTIRNRDLFYQNLATTSQYDANGCPPEIPPNMPMSVWRGKPILHADVSDYVTFNYAAATHSTSPCTSANLRLEAAQEPCNFFCGWSAKETERVEHYLRAISIAPYKAPSLHHAAIRDQTLWVNNVTAETFHLAIKQQHPATATGRLHWVVNETGVQWRASETALVVVDMWDRHWCPVATAHVSHMAAAINRTANIMRESGAHIVWAPSDTTERYTSSPARRHTLSLPARPLPRANYSYFKLGNMSSMAVRKRLAIDASVPPWRGRIERERMQSVVRRDTNRGCDVPGPKKGHRVVWTRQIETLTIHDNDFIVSNSKQEFANILAATGAKNVVYAGQALNLCILGRKFGIATIRAWGWPKERVAILSDLTYTLYNTKDPPHVSKKEAHELQVAAIEQYWGASFHSSQLFGTS